MQRSPANSHDDRLISDEDTQSRNAATSATQTIATTNSHPDLQEAIMAALKDLLPTLPVLQSVQDDFQQLRAELVATQKEVRRNGRLIALMWNANARLTDSATFEVVPFANFDDPTTAPHNLPLLNTPAAIKELRGHHLRAYVRGYHPDLQIPDDTDKCFGLIFAGIGAYGHAREYPF